ncbi:MAG TPA: hypothetical protein VHZ24_06860 [Pirellulales bacterium]|jgi:hypothetical protein|nr:hypothetical protein [Pirellulales bacterium]
MTIRSTSDTPRASTPLIASYCGWRVLSTWAKRGPARRKPVERRDLVRFSQVADRAPDRGGGHHAQNALGRVVIPAAFDSFGDLVGHVGKLVLQGAELHGYRPRK